MTDNLRAVVRGWWRSGASTIEVAGILGIYSGDIDLLFNSFETEVQEPVNSEVA